MLKRSLFGWISVILWMTVSSSPVDAQEPTSVFGEQIEVRVVNLEVVVTDRDGNRVSGLSPEDFRLRVDGDDVPISFFSEIAEGQRRQQTAAAPESPEVVEDSNPTGVAPGETVGTSYLVFLDNYFVPVQRDRDQVLQSLMEQAANLGPQDRMALVGFNGRRLEMLSSWTNSRLQIERAIEKAMEQPARGRGVGSAVSEFSAVDQLDAEEQPSGEAALGIGDSTLTASDRAERATPAVQRIEAAVERVVLGVTATMRSFAKPPGRKVMLLLSGGWPRDACTYVMGQVNPLDGGIVCDGQGSKIWRPMYEVANLLGYTLYPIDMPRSSIDIGADENDLTGLARNGPGVGGDQTQVVNATFRESETHSTLRQLAVETGGLPMINEARLSALEQVIEDTRSYYWMGFTPEWRGDDRSRKIRLEVLKPGLKLRYRENFQDLSRAKEIDFMVESALVFGDLPGAGKLGLELGEAGRGRRVKLPLQLTIPMDEITMLPHQGRYIAELELRVGALDKFGDRNEIATVPVVLEGGGPPPLGAHAIYEVAIKIRRQPQDLVVSLYDPIGDRILVANARFEP